MAEMMNRRKKWGAKNRVRVALSMETLYQAHSTRLVLTYQMAERRFVMTVTPQKDIWPHRSM